MGTYSSADVLCPFYLRDDPKTCCITCEGMVPGSSVRSHFLNGEALRGQIRKYCAAEYEKCPWARALYGKYGELG